MWTSPRTWTPGYAAMGDGSGLLRYPAQCCARPVGYCRRGSTAGSAPAWVRDLLASEREEAAADAEQAALLERVRAGEPGIAVSFEELASRLGLDQDPPSAGPAG
jgi:hypothetical protein